MYTADDIANMAMLLVRADRRAEHAHTAASVYQEQIECLKSEISKLKAQIELLDPKGA